MTSIEFETPMDPGKKAAVKAAGGIRSLARKLGLSHVSVLRWTTIPVRRLLDIESVTGVPREELRPDIFRTPNAGRRKSKGTGPVS
jgi:DNA-binding transcriptional regulator YdaS (Cro superfamily)